MRKSGGKLVGLGNHWAGHRLNRALAERNIRRRDIFFYVELTSLDCFISLGG